MSYFPCHISFNFTGLLKAKCTGRQKEPRIVVIIINVVSVISMVSIISMVIVINTLIATSTVNVILIVVISSVIFYQVSTSWHSVQTQRCSFSPIKCHKADNSIVAVINWLYAHQIQPVI